MSTAPAPAPATTPALSATTAAAPATAATLAPHRQWDIFCRVIDNFGDIGVCWRLASNLAQRGQCVRLWTDDASALHWMAPQGFPGVQVRPWGGALATHDAPTDVLVEAFGCEITPDFIAACALQAKARGQKPAWINLEYLSAERYVERCHGLPSPVLHGPAAGWTKWFFYPGFTPATGGLLREADVLARQAQFDRAAWRHTHLTNSGNAIAPAPTRPSTPDVTPVAHAPTSTSASAPTATAFTPAPAISLPTPAPAASPASAPTATPTRWISLFCYEPPALPALLAQCMQADYPTHLLVTHGRASAATQAALEQIKHQNGLQPLRDKREQLSISYLPPVPHRAFDEMLWACDLNLVRGEDSLVRALWAGQALVWQIYPQDDNAHHGKLQAFLDWLQAPPSLRQFHAVWNGIEALPLPLLDDATLREWAACVQAARTRLLAQNDLVSQLMGWCEQKR